MAMWIAGVCKARFIGVLRGQHRPAVLIEAGFLSNSTEARRIEDPAFRQKLAEAIANALTETNLVHSRRISIMPPLRRAYPCPGANANEK